ncbi:PQQ-like beta-propeller repeat protein [Paracoccus pacificus]|uniref:PQQ-binding-like beta-propeller repeat protein n=1 Tax=Paracoccus pacificus TaxID=1463598 RepID=A0ABW4R849_9RHOB
MSPVSMFKSRKLLHSPALLAGFAGVVLLSACQEREIILPGQRLDPRTVTSPDGPPVEGAAAAPMTQAMLPAAQNAPDAVSRAGTPSHVAGNRAIGGGAQLIWSAPVGQPDDRRHRITADPVVAGGIVYAMDSRARVTATATNGGRVWQTDLTPTGENPDSASGGGLAYENGRVFATTGFGELVALDARSGGIAWRQRTGSPIGGAPTAERGTVYAVARDSSGWAVREADGKVLWQVSASRAQSGVTGVPAPAADGDLVVFPFSTGELMGVGSDGQQRWVADVAGSRIGRAISLLRDMTGEPVISGGRVYAATSSGRIYAFDRQTGETIWTAREGANSAPLVTGNAVYVVNDQAQLVRLDAATGGRVWAIDLPYYTDARVKKQDRITASYGPILAGNRLFVASSDGQLRIFDPTSGAPLGAAAIPGGAATAPVVAGQTLYVTGRDGNLHAFR